MWHCTAHSRSRYGYSMLQGLQVTCCCNLVSPAYSTWKRTPQVAGTEAGVEAHRI